MKLSFTQAVNEASTLGWGTRVKGFVACFVVGAACTVLVRICNDFYLKKMLFGVRHNKEERREGRCGPTGSSGPEECCRCDARFIRQHWSSCSSEHEPWSFTEWRNKNEQPHVTLSTCHLSCPPVCVAGGVHALPPQDWTHSLHCVLHFWKHMCSGQVSVHNNENQAAEDENFDGFISRSQSVI